MGPTTYALCQKAVIGPAMWFAGLCAFPPLLSSVVLPLEVVGTVTSTFTVPVDKNYEFLLEFEFTSTEARVQDKIVGNTYTAECKDNPISLFDKPQYGHPIPIRVVIRKAVDRAIVVDSQFVSLCLQSHAGNRKSRSIGWVTLARGNYIAEVTNLAIQAGLTNTTTSISLVSGGGK